MAKKMADTQTNLTVETYREQLQICNAAKRAMEEASAIYKHKLKEAKKLGVDTKEMTACMRLKAQETAEVQVKFNTQMKYLGWMGMQIGQQAGLFDDDIVGDNAVISDMEAEQTGYDAGLAGAVVESCPYLQGTEHAVIWVKGLNAGRQFMGKIGIDPTKAAAVVAVGRKKRGSSTRH